MVRRTYCGHRVQEEEESSDKTFTLASIHQYP
jgi:hypothetical protein